MKNSVKEMDFVTLKNNFDAVCEDVNEKGESVALTLKNGRKVFIMPEENYDDISHFVIKSVSANTLTN